VSFLLLDVALVGAGIVVGRMIARSIRARGAASNGPDATPAAPPPRDAFEGFPCTIGDVITRSLEGDEAWLAGALVFEEERPVAALFIAPEAGGDRAVLVEPGGGGESSVPQVTWLAELDAAKLPALAPSAEPPHVIEHQGERYQRTRRLPVKVSRHGSGAPAMGPDVILAIYAGAGASRLLVVSGPPKSRTWAGVALREGEFDILPGEGA
jgi:hypothetical protein